MTVLLLALTLVLGNAATCDAQLPPTLRAALRAKAPGFRVPAPKPTAETTCPFVAHGDFDGDERDDIAVLMSNASKTQSKIFAAIADETNWQVVELPAVDLAVHDAWIDARPKNDIFTNVNSDKLDSSNSDQFWKQRMDARFACIETGSAEAGINAYCYDGSAWHGVVSVVGPVKNCAAILPKNLTAALRKLAPGLRVLEVRDLDPLYRYRGCYNIASGDFNGDRQTDYAVILTDAKDEHSKVFAALADGGTWKIKELPPCSDKAVWSYVSAAKPGTSEHTQAAAFDPSRGPFWLEKMTSPHTTIACGQQESGGGTYAYIGGEWHGVVTSD